MMMTNNELLNILFERFPNFSKEFNINSKQFNPEFDMYKLYEEYFNKYIIVNIRRVKKSENAKEELKKIGKFLEELVQVKDFKIECLVQVAVLEGVMSSPRDMMVFKDFLLPSTKELGRIANLNCKINYKI
jgi:hypothetical protein